MSVTTTIKMPTRTVLVIISVISIALASSALHTYSRLNELGESLLESRAFDITSRITQNISGPQKWSSLVPWQKAFSEIFQEGNQETVLFLAVVDQSGKILIREGFPELISETSFEMVKKTLDPSIFWYEHNLPQRRGGPRWESESDFRGNRLWIGLSREPARALEDQAFRHLLISALTILTLWGLGIYLLHTFRRFLDLKSREESEKHLAILGQMSATLAHEIRNPLGAMKGLSQVALEDLEDNEKAGPMLRTVVNEAERLEGLVVDLLTFARPKEPTIQSFDLNNLVAEIVDLLSPESNREQVTIKRDGSGQILIRSDLDGLRQVLLNVLRNAVEASPKPGAVQIRIKSDKSAVTLEVQDNGPGLGTSDPEELFQPFRTTKAKGSGLGLAVCRQIMDRIGGSISLKNGQDKGAVCSIQIPAS